MKLSDRSANIAPFHAMDVLAAASERQAAGHPVISLAVGQPAHPAPQAALAAARQALEHGRLGYTDASGRSSLRAAIAADYRARHDIDLDPARVIVTTGSSAAFNLAFLALFDPGDAVMITRPGYPAYRNILATLGLRVIEVETGGRNSPFLTPAMVEAAAEEAKDVPIAGLLMASPANPTGTVTPPDDLKALIDFCQDYDITFISDEIYHGLTYAGGEESALTFSDQLVVINSFSKYYCMTGWRIGWMVVPQQAARTVERLAQSLYISPPEIAQIAAEAALLARDELDLVRDGYRANRDFLLEALPQVGLVQAAPMDGAFYAYVDISAYSDDSMIFARQLLHEAHVAVTPGIDFDPVDGHRTIRLSYAGDNASIREAMARMAQFLDTCVKIDPQN